MSNHIVKDFTDGGSYTVTAEDILVLTDKYRMEISHPNGFSGVWANNNSLVHLTWAGGHTGEHTFLVTKHKNNGQADDGKKPKSSATFTITVPEPEPEPEPESVTPSPPSPSSAPLPVELSTASGTLHIERRRFVLLITHSPGVAPPSGWVERKTGAPAPLLVLAAISAKPRSELGGYLMVILNCMFTNLYLFGPASGYGNISQPSGSAGPSLDKGGPGVVCNGNDDFSVVPPGE